jgi:ribonucleotide reductase alpha subunit
MEELFVRETVVSESELKTEKGKGKPAAEKMTEGKMEEKPKKNATKTYSHDEAFEASCVYFAGDELAARVWANKYALKDSFGNLYEKTPDDMHRRIAKEIHRIELKYKNPLPEDLIYNVLKEFRYIVPQGSPMTGIGNEYQIASLSNCFVIGNDGDSDSYGGIMKIDQEQVQLMKRRGGVGQKGHLFLTVRSLQPVLFRSWKDIRTPPAKLHRTAGGEHSCSQSRSSIPMLPGS